MGEAGLVNGSNETFLVLTRMSNPYIQFDMDAKIKLKVQKIWIGDTYTSKKTNILFV